VTKLRRLKSYREKSLYVRVVDFLLEKIVLVQEKNLATNRQEERLVKLKQYPTIDVDLNHWE
jgi:hypothetical protein